ncbi:MAG: hypothetical protein RLZZ460_934, partial [Chloroflexota bacterium]
ARRETGPEARGGSSDEGCERDAVTEASGGNARLEPPSESATGEANDHRR